MLRITSPATLGERGTVRFVWGSGDRLGAGGRERMDGAPSARLAASPSCFSHPTSSSAISRGRRKVISDLTPKSQLLVAAPRSGTSAAPSLGSGSLTLSSPRAQRPAAAAPLTPARQAARLLGEAPWIPRGDHERARLQGAANLGHGEGGPERCRGARGRAGVSGTKRDVWIVLTSQTDALRHVCIYGIHMLSWQMKGQ